jgi:hypothetical protein
VQIQADEIVSEDAHPAVLQQVTTTFADEMEGISVGQEAPQQNFTASDANTSAGLVSFLQRPVRIDTYTWLETDPIGVTRTISPWQLFFNDPSIKYKLNNFAFISCDLKLKVIVNASPFYYGAQRLCYQPLPLFKPATTGTGTPALVPYSQQPGLWIIPQNSEGGEMTLPFFFQKDYLNVQRAADFTNMGTLRFVTYAPLDSANGVTGAGVSVQVYAWAENVILSGPSVGVALQSDEYGDGIVSRPASIVSKIAGTLKGVPIIGKFATATEMGARAVGGIAKLFGFTNVPVIADTVPYRPTPFPQFASPEIGYPVEKLTLDAKNELAIDPSVVGLDGKDPLAIENLACRDSFLVSTAWTTTTPVDTPLFTTNVNPFMYRSSGTVNTNNNQLYLTPSAMVANMFNNWRGDIIYTFKVIASKYHKGRLRVSYDPNDPAVQTTGDTGSMTYNKIIDLGEESEFEIRIPYHQALPWLLTQATPGTAIWTTSTTPALTKQLGANGILSLKVLTLLTAPVATAPVNILISVKCGDNIEFANPRPMTGLSPFVVQSDEDDGKPRTEFVPGTNTTLDMRRYRVNFGECVKSVRPLLRRSNINEVWSAASVPTGASYQAYKFQWRYPKTYGYDPATYNTAKGLIVPANTFPFNYSPMTPYNWVTNCFIGQRGAIMWHLVPDSPSPLSNLRAYRQVLSNPGFSQPLTYNNLSGTSSSISSTMAGTAGGCAVTNCTTVNGFSLSIPNMTNYKFQSTRPDMGTRILTATDTDDGSNFETFLVDFVGVQADNPLANVRINAYFGVGTDYTPLFFLNVPVMYQLMSNPTPA